MRIQNGLIFALVIVCFFGTTLFFWSFHTRTLRTSLEAGTLLFSSLLADEIEQSIPRETLLSQSADSLLSQALQGIGEGLENEHDIWIADKQGTVRYRSGTAEENGLTGEVLSVPGASPAAVRWLGRPLWPLLAQQCCVVRQFYVDTLFLAVVNYADSARTVQRQQFALLMVVELLLVLVMTVLVVNNFAKYRRELIRFATTDELRTCSIINVKILAQDKSYCTRRRREAGFVPGDRRQRSAGRFRRVRN